MLLFDSRLGIQIPRTADFYKPHPYLYILYYTSWLRGKVA